ncbi:hypothetical protein PybrP1_009532 [[Pythium] brassicae (nom. inval.)]|nr:hypothetical protein PybrP1_009532 [[Pythium] brassicae (nom. inval.)]
MWRRHALRATTTTTRRAPALALAAATAVALATTCVRPPARAANSKTASGDCASATALLVFRGLGAGLAWTVGVDGYALLNAPDALWAERAAAAGRASSASASAAGVAAREMGRTFAWLAARNMLGFASFLGIFGGVSCSLERLRGRSDLLNPFAGGFCAGLALLPGELRSPRAIVTSAALCGVASMGFHYFVPTSGQSQRVAGKERIVMAERDDDAQT